MAACDKDRILPATSSITNPECKSDLYVSKDSIFLDVTVCECCAGCQSHGRGVFSSAGFLLVLDVTSLVTGSETTGGVPIRRNTTIPECVLHVINMSENSLEILGFFVLMCGSAFYPVGVVLSR